ncbi:6085_t:CDS:1, partial [Racocetra fulgida]
NVTLQARDLNNCQIHDYRPGTNLLKIPKREIPDRPYLAERQD